jgi:SAM-dependent methyltransferase
MDAFYGPEQSAIHHARFGDLAARAAGHVAGLLGARGVTSGTWVDLGCGSGILARAAIELGFDVVGVDVSSAMLDLAREQAPTARFVEANAFDTDVPPCVAVTATGEVLGYLTAGESAGALPDRLAALFARVRGALSPEGVLVFDLAGPGRQAPPGGVQRVHDGDGWLLTMTARLGDDAVLERAVTIFTHAEGNCWNRTDELQRLRLLPPTEVVTLLEQQGFTTRVHRDYADGEGLPGWAVYEATPGVTRSR